MYLKRLEINGFKSFADKTNVEFVSGITAVVGPNGSGKSNIADAIRWVLGEQSAKSLRGEKMEDIIFSGCDSRKPVNYAEVSLVLDNQDKSLKVDFSEVMVTRRLYRSGDSEYYINKQHCRLKDVTELFMDTGLGKEAYSIIGQGKIDEVLSSKAEDRRGVFEDAAGIVKYKTRKKEAQKKLENTEHNLIRIYDLISELDCQIEPLEEQARVAKEYKEYSKRLQDLNIKIYVNDIETAYETWQKTEKLKKEATEIQVEYASQVNQIDASIEQKRWHINQIDKELEELHQKLVETSEKVEQAEGKKDVLSERNKNYETNRGNALETIEKLMLKKAEINTQLESEQNKLIEIETKIKDLTKQLLNEENSIQELLNNYESQVEIYKSDYFECLNDKSTLRNEISHINSSKERLYYKKDKVNNDKELIKNEIELINEKSENLKVVIDSLRSEIERLANEESDILNTYKNQQNKLEYVQNDLRDFQQKYNSLNSRQEILLEMQTDFSGYNYGVKEILKLRESKKLNGVYGAVAELIKVPKQYEIALETALGASLQNIVVESENVARQAISYLKEKKLGRATFLPLDVIKGKTLNSNDLDKLKKIDGYVGQAVNLIEIDSKYTSIGSFLLGQVIVATNLKVANEIAKTLGYSRRIVTIEGDIVNPGGSMTGGKVIKNKNNLLSRQREIDELKKQIDSFSAKIKEKQSSNEKIKADITNLKYQLEFVRKNLSDNKNNHQENQASYLQIEFEQKNVNERSISLQQDFDQILIDIDELDKNEEKLLKEIKENEFKEKDLQKKIDLAESIRKKDESAKEEMNKAITEIKVNLARINQEKEGSLSLVSRFEKEIYELISSIEEQQNILIQLENDLSNQKTDKDDMNAIIEQMKSERDKVQRLIDSKRKIRSEYSINIDNEQANSKDLRRDLKNIETELNKHEIKLSRVDAQLENLLKQLTEEYEMSYEWAKANIERIDNITEARNEIQRLKRAIQILGEVNIGAIEEYERVYERYNFLTTQKEDLVEAKDTLYQVIKEVDEEMIKLFSESFTSIREQFQIVFRKLFDGGNADLILTQPDNLLDTGIEIVAQPPGKKLQNIALLSGGEKALTAITLLFSILRVRPVPFSVLDEVEAALDEANVTRFSEYLREFCVNTQFIIITHRKGTMEGADVLYGVTMQESGVSRLVSVKLEDSDKVMQMA